MVRADQFSWNFGPPDQNFRRTKISVTVPCTSTNGAFLYFCYTLLYYGLSLYLRSSALCHLGSNTSRRDTCLGCDANYAHLPAATGQYGDSGHVINLPQDVASFSNTLPQLSSELDVIIVRQLRSGSPAPRLHRRLLP